MNERARRMIRGDGRNPYGSRGGYVTSRDPRGRRDRGEQDEPYMDNRHEYDTGYHHREYDEYPYAKMRGSFEYDRYGDGDDYDYGYGDDMRDYRGGRRMDYGADYRGRARNAMGQYTSRGGRRDRGMDYGDDEEMELSKHDIKEWEEDMKNEDGTRGFHFTKEQVEDVAKRIGIDPKEFGDHSLWVATNMKYSDEYNVAKKFGVDRPEFYVESAKSFLKDKDFDGDGAEKLYIYYKTIVEKDD